MQLLEKLIPTHGHKMALFFLWHRSQDKAEDLYKHGCKGQMICFCLLLTHGAVRISRKALKCVFRSIFW
jgi:hypothetical protein